MLRKNANETEMVANWMNVTKRDTQHELLKQFYRFHENNEEQQTEVKQAKRICTIYIRLIAQTESQCGPADEIGCYQAIYTGKWIHLKGKQWSFG